MKTLYISDLDGTLLNQNETLSEDTVKTVSGLIEKGMCFSYATGRSYASASIAARGLAVNMPVIVYNGACILDPVTGDILYSLSFDENQKKMVEDFLFSVSISPIVYAYVDGRERVTWLPNRENEGVRYYINSRKGDKRLRPVDDYERLYEGSSFYFTCIGEKDELQPVYDKFKSLKGYTCIFRQELYRDEYWCEILPEQATKGNALKQLKQISGCDKIVSFGDEVNDMSMFSVSDECYAMENAVDSLKAMATAVIGSNSGDGVARWLSKNFCVKYTNP